MSIEKRIEHLERLAGVKQKKIRVFITSYVEDAPNCKECPEPKKPYWDNKSFVVFPDKACDCEIYRKRSKGRGKI
ncbi:MAG: hypothetical protein AB1306_07635 [Nitrospirota bacterium]